MDATLRRTARRNDTGPSRPQTDARPAYHPEYGSPLDPAPGWKWEFNATTARLLPSISDEPSRHYQPRFGTPKWPRPLYRWHEDQRYYSLVRDDEDDWEEYDDALYTYDAERLLFKRYQPVVAPLPPLPPPKPRQLEPARRRQFFVRHRDGSYAPVPRREEYSRDDLYEYDAKKNRVVRVGQGDQ